MTSGCPYFSIIIDAVSRCFAGHPAITDWAEGIIGIEADVVVATAPVDSISVVRDAQAFERSTAEPSEV